MDAVVGQAFPVAKLTGFVEATCPSGAAITFARVSASGSTRTGVGEMTVLFPPARDGWRRRQVHMQLSIKIEYHQSEFLSEIRRAVFSALGIKEDATWLLSVSPQSVIEVSSDPPSDVIGFTSS